MSAIKNYLHSLETLTAEELRANPLNNFSLQDLSSDDWDLIIGAIHAALTQAQKSQIDGAASHYKDLYQRLLFARIKTHSLNLSR